MRQIFAGSGVARAGLFHLALSALVLVAVLVPGSDARANIVLGDHLGTFAGNDDVSSLFSDLGLQVTQLAKVEDPATSADGLTLSFIMFNGDSEPISGQWEFTGAGLVDILVVKAGNDYAVFMYTDANTSNMRNIGLWDTSQLDNKGMSHITAYQLAVIPLPAALPLLGSALATFGIVGWRRRHGKTAKAAAA